ncbi:TonB-dependent copper receptor [Pelosinus sp. sgz500959]|uniref:TonB-dependent copper receptor n=1 Tax=Pelosinus sp. sgz500959 TaxID=3242472 RepID=UPI0036706B0A
MNKSHAFFCSFLLFLASTTAVTSTAFAATEENPEKDVISTFEEVVVTAPSIIDPLVVETNPKAPRQPVPAADGGGYLKNIPGFSVIRQGGTGSDPVFRGLNGTRLNVLLDGTSLLGGCPSRMDPTTSYAFPESFSKIKILKGPESVRYGGGNVAGTILFERETTPFFKPEVRVNSSLLVGSAGRNDELLDVTAGDTTGYVRIIKTRSHADDYIDGSGNKIHSFYTRQSLSAIAGWTPNRNTLYEFAVDTSTAQAAYAGRTMDGAKFDQQDYSLKFEKENISPLVSKIQFKAYHNYVDHVMDNFSLRPNTSMMAMWMDVDRVITGGRLTADLALNPKIQATVGVDYQKNEHTGRMGMSSVSYDSRPRTPDLTFTNYGIFGDFKRSVDQNNRLLSGLRLDHLNVKNTTDTDTNRTYGAFLRYEHDAAKAPLTSYVGIGHAERPADYWERHSGTGNFFLKPEKNTQLDTGFLYNNGKVKANTSLFYSNIKDFILFTTNGNSNIGSNIDATLYGGEGEISYALDKNWTTTASLSYTRGTNDTSHKALAQIPALEGTLGLKYNKEKIEAGLLWRGVQKQTHYDVGSGTPTAKDLANAPGGFGILSTNIAYKPNKHIIVAAGVDNIFNKNYAEFLSRKGEPIATLGIPTSFRVNEPGRTIWLKTSYSF